MFERYLTDLLTTHCGHVVENFDAEKARLSAWSGKIVLEDLALRSDALDHFVEKCPVELAYGKVGSIDIQVPWSLVGAQLWRRRTTKNQDNNEAESSDDSNAVSIILSDVNLLITPRRKSEADPGSKDEEESKDDSKEQSKQVTEKEKREAKQKAAQDFLDAQLLTRLAVSTSQTSTRWKWAQEWLSSLLSNLKVTIRNIHVRYEDPGSCMGFLWDISDSRPTQPRRYRKTFSVGITLGEFSVKSKKDNARIRATRRTVSSDNILSTKSSDGSDTDASSVDSREGLSSQQKEAPQISRAYKIRRKVVAAEKLAVYWDSGGCYLMSQMAPVEKFDNRLTLDRAYVNAVFSVLNGAGTDPSFPDGRHFIAPHFYLLDPISPSVYFTLVTQNETSSSVKDSGTTGAPRSLLPPSSIDIILPPTPLAISRRTLEDIVYIRKSMSVWIHAKKGLLSERTLKRLAKLRPTRSAVDDPRGWWKYACEAAIAFTKIERQGQEPKNLEHASNLVGRPSRNRLGWLDVAQALARRKRYIGLYRELFRETSGGDIIAEGAVALSSEERRIQAHKALLQMEDDMTVPEICAFRIAAYYALIEHGKPLSGRSESGVDMHAPKFDRQRFDTKDFTATQTTIPPSNSVVQNLLSLESRCRGFIEMAQALEREKVNTEMRAKEEENETISFLRSGRSLTDAGEGNTRGLWEIAMSCTELSLQVNDQTSENGRRRFFAISSTVPIAKLSCACVVESVLYLDGSWEVDCSIASLAMRDLCAYYAGGNPLSGKSCPNHFRDLIGPKYRAPQTAEETLILNDISLRRSVHMNVKRTLQWYVTDMKPISPTPEMGSTTKTNVRLFPMEVTYSTVPVEALTRILATFKTPQLSDDYQRMAGRVYQWREKQKKRLLRALAHKRKKIYVDVDVTAPVLLIPETCSHIDSPMLVVDFGLLQFSNAVPINGAVNSGPAVLDDSQFDDAWCLSLKNMQVQCYAANRYRQSDDQLSCEEDADSTYQSSHQVVEPLSLDFSIFTKVAAEGEQTRFRITATMPQLSFNFKSSSVRLMDRLKTHWIEQKGTGSSKTSRPQAYTTILDTASTSSSHGVRQGQESSSVHPSVKKPLAYERTFEFRFSAPLIKLCVENDVDDDLELSTRQPNGYIIGLNACKQMATPLVHVAVHGIRGNLVQERTTYGCHSTTFDARLHSLSALDLYQTAGRDYSLLASSLEPQNVLESLTRPEVNLHVADIFAVSPKSKLSPEADLVWVSFSSKSHEPNASSSDLNRVSESTGGKLSIVFHELFVEWNPETIAALQKAMRTPPQIDRETLSKFESQLQEGEEEQEIDEVFFDAEEGGEEAEYFFDTLSEACNEDLNAGIRHVLQESFLSGIRHSKEESFNSLDQPFVAENVDKGSDNDYTPERTSPDWRPYIFEFKLSKLRVNFNKESRHRRLLVAEMDRTDIKYRTRPTGGSQTHVHIGNLVFSDPSSSQNNTLYREILGLQTDKIYSSQTTLKSLLEMEIVINPRDRQVVEGSCRERTLEFAKDRTVSICYEDGTVNGCDTFVSARFSPMRFVYLQQLWSEIVDYFFEGVMGYEVWGKPRPSTVEVQEPKSLNRSSGSGPLESVDPFQVSFTRFDVFIDSPVVVLPVTYRSTQFIRLNAGMISLSNHFSVENRINTVTLAHWHNNCKVSFSSLRTFNWEGKEISNATKKVDAVIGVRWPIGPQAYLEVPKWNVSCDFESLDLHMNREDYALFQNIISHNVGEASRGLDEWDALQNLSPKELAHYKQKIMVHFGYDKKDVAPTTYNVALKLPLISISLVSNRETILATAKCSDLVYEMQKFDDRISRQRVSCNIDLIQPKNESDDEILLSCVRSDSKCASRDLVYTSTSIPTGDNVKTIDITNGRIYMAYPAWISLSGFFSGLPEVEILSPQEVASTVQVGDRWYRIGNSRLQIEANLARKRSAPRVSWINATGEVTKARDHRNALSNPSFQLRLTLSSPCIVLSSSTALGTNVILRLRHLDFLHSNGGSLGTTSKSFFLHGLELYTSSASKQDLDSHSHSEGNSLIHPWCIAGISTSCNNGKDCSCDSHCLRMSADVLKARAAFSDMMVSIDVCLRLLTDIRQSSVREENSTTPSNNSGSTLENASSPRAIASDNIRRGPKVEFTTLDWDGFILDIIDDSRRHFAGSQELITLAIGRVLFSRNDSSASKESDVSSSTTGLSYEMALYLMSVEIFDCLQLESSPFCLLATSLSGGQYKKHDYFSSRSQMEWDKFSIDKSDVWGFRPSQYLLERLPEKECLSNVTDQAKLDSIVLQSFGHDFSRNYVLKLNAFSLQWSPSTVIAMQRFMGRLKKQAVKSLRVIDEEFSRLMTETESGRGVAMNPAENISVVVDIEALTICLNKEHQYRRLLQICLKGGHVTIENNKLSSFISGSVRDLNAWDCDSQKSAVVNHPPNMCVFKVTDLKTRSGRETVRSRPFLEIRYRTFKAAHSPTADEFPDWISSHLSSDDGDIDDYLSVSIASVELTYLRDRSEEILDYLSNGLPGKGMGKVHKSAQGFLEKRIRTKSFLQVRIEAPTLLIPRDRSAKSGISMRLGDMALNSWFEAGTGEGRIKSIELDKDFYAHLMAIPRSDFKSMETEWWRMVSLRISNLSAGIFSRESLSQLKVSSLNQPLDISLVLQKSAWEGRTLSMRCRFPLVDIVLNYSHYCHIHAVLRENIGKKIDRDKWDNVEKAYDLEIEMANENSHLGKDVTLHSKPLEYASGARRIRYGTKLNKSKSNDSTGPIDGSKRSEAIDLKLIFDGFALRLHRDDYVDGLDECYTGGGLGYDMLLLRVQVVEVSVTRKTPNDISLHLSLYRIGLFDLGDHGRLIRENFFRTNMTSNGSEYHNKTRLPSAFSVLVEGYSSAEKDSVSGFDDGSTVTNFGDGDDAQLVITVDSVPAASVGTVRSWENPTQNDIGDARVVIARVVVNYLSINALIRPFKEILAFFALAWPTDIEQSGDPFRNEVAFSNNEGKQLKINKRGSSVSCLQMKLVAHYPRIFFVADESDPHSRALVLRGLAVVSADRTTKRECDNFSFTEEGDEDIEENLAVEAQLEGLESYINPDVNDVLSLQRRHVDLLGSASNNFVISSSNIEQSALGVALLQPVTTGIELKRNCRSRFPSKRLLSVNVEPISTMLSFEDLQLIESVFMRWKTDRTESSTSEIDECTGGGDLTRSEDIDHSAENYHPMTEKQTSLPVSNIPFDVIFKTRQLGLGLRKDGEQVVVDELIDTTSHTNIHVGDILVLIGGCKLWSYSLPSVVQQIAKQPRPLRLTFLRPQGTSKMKKVKERNSIQRSPVGPCSGNLGVCQTRKYTLRFKRGVAHGMTLQKSSLCDIPVVVHLHPALSHAVVADGELHGSATIPAAPRSGALITQISDRDTAELGFSESAKLLEHLCSDVSRVRSSYKETDTGSTFIVTFFEAESSAWGTHDNIRVSLSGAGLTFIDDLNGRDMPLLRGNLQSLELQFEQGMGIRTSLLDVKKDLPSIMRNTNQKNTGPASDLTLNLCAVARTMIEYFHPRISVYEPLLEPAQLCIIFEHQYANAAEGRPGQLAMELSDRLLRESVFDSPSAHVKELKPQLICMNFSDAAAEVFARALHEWGVWRSSVKSQPEMSLLVDNSVPELVIASPPHAQDLNKILLDRKSTSQDSNAFYEGVEEQNDQTRTVKQVAARNAAHAALLFAQKRGADRGGKSETSTPFVFRNRTGVSIAFVPQKNRRYHHDSKASRRKSLISLVGEYNGLEQYELAEVTELADGEDAKFHMDVLAEISHSSDYMAKAKRVRTYEGQFPQLTVAIQAIAGVVVDPVPDLQVNKAGNLIRQLSVHNSEVTDGAVGGSVGSSNAHFFVPVVWKVEVEDNRRILTLSSAVRVISLGSTSGIEIGVVRKSAMVDSHDFPWGNSAFHEDANAAPLQGNSHVDNEVGRKSVEIMSYRVGGDDNIQSIGLSQPQNPFYLPLWLALKQEVVKVYVRPRVDGRSGFSWGERSVLEFSPSPLSPTKKRTDWIWQDPFGESLGSIKCDAIDTDDEPAFLSCYASGFKGFTGEGDAPDDSIEAKHQASISEIFSVSIDAGLTLQNMLPTNIEWEAAHGMGPAGPYPVDGSTVRHERLKRSSFEASPGETSALKCGDRADIYACNFKIEAVLARFRLGNRKEWSSWAPLSTPYENDPSDDCSILEDDFVNETRILPSVRQINIQVEDDFGVPVTLGIRIVPKIARASESLSSSLCYGLDIIIFAELWVGNLTSLPLVFGCPGVQIHAHDESDKIREPNTDAHVATKFSAEAALMEIASVLELGSQGTGIDTRSSAVAASAGEMYNIPHQNGSMIIEEMFEFIETKDSTVKRRWWGTESYWNLRDSKILDLQDTEMAWQWTDEYWKIDCTGGASARTGGWESCKNLLGSGEGPFSGRRDFNPDHPFRRRRWFRARTTNQSGYADTSYHKSMDTPLLPGLQAFHHPIVDSFSRMKREKNKQKKKKKKKRNMGNNENEGLDSAKSALKKGTEDDNYRVAIKCGDGRWSVPAVIPSRGTCRGIVKVFASRWLSLTKTQSKEEDEDTQHEKVFQESGASHTFGSAPLDPGLYELVYDVSEVDGEWGELSRLMLVSARFCVRNDSKQLTMEIKQSGTRDCTALRLSPGEITPFHWTDFHLPQLACVRPVVLDSSLQNIYKWSGGFDVCRLGMTALLIRQVSEQGYVPLGQDPVYQLRTVRSLVEIRPGTGGTGINLSFKEEMPNGDGALFRIENTSTFNVWLAQDGVLANPSASAPYHTSMADGDLIRPGDQISFGLDVPFRQGKYAHRKAATMAELLRVRVGLSPLSSHAGIETTKVIGLSTVGESIRLKPSKLVTVLSTAQRKALERVRILVVTTADGPSRVLKFCLMAEPEVDTLSNSFMESVAYSAVSDSLVSGPLTEEALKAAHITEGMLRGNQLPSEGKAKQKALFGNRSEDVHFGVTEEGSATDQLYSVSFIFSGFLISLVDSSPSEICTVAVSSLNVLAKWNLMRTLDASFLMSIGWLQIDNHCPSAPFPIILCPDDKESDRQGNDLEQDPATWPNFGPARADTTPFLVIGVDFAPYHSSGIMCLKSVTVAPRNMAIFVDLALLVRLQSFMSGIQSHFEKRKTGVARLHRFRQTVQSKLSFLPDIDRRIREVEDAAATGVGRQQVYFGALAILPYAIKLSVAPVRALTPTQAAFEGSEAAAIHQAVRKGDLRLGRNSSPLGVTIGSKNTTAIAVVRGVAKSIVVDALLRLDGASLNFAGAFLRNQIFYGPQLATYLGAHYMQSLRQNVPALLGSLAFFGNPIGLLRGLGDGVTDFVTEPVKGMKRSIQRLDPSHMVNGVARGTGSLARHTVGGFAASSALLTSTFSKNMAVLTLDRRYAQKRDRGNDLREQQGGDFFILDGMESGFVKLAQGFVEGVTGVVKAPMRGAERSGFEGFAKGIGKGLLGLVVKPMIGISDAATDVMIGVRSSVEGDMHQGSNRRQVRPRRAMYGRDRVLRNYSLADAAACALMLRTRIGGQSYLSHLDMDDRVALLSEQFLLLLDSGGKELLLVKFQHISNVELRELEDSQWGLLIMLDKPWQNGSELEIITCKDQREALELRDQIKHGLDIVENNL